MENDSRLQKEIDELKTERDKKVIEH